ncbi:MAG TPA: hypothetical protein PK788_00290 [Gemmatimonadaceae bacterium]|nr:hypothetical protein [Gemmatimonadaceae bacterium]HRQ77520.1 hypothetical protein [Gemmatimonadaceae bacterium]
MTSDDDFALIVPRHGEPVIVEPGDDLSEYVGSQLSTRRRAVALKSGRSVTGTIYAIRELSGEDEIAIEVLVNEFFAKA